jgi:hypothetical protein
MECNLYKNQNLNELSSGYDSNNLFEDPEFPASRSSIFHFNPPRGLNPDNVEWKRPNEISSNPEFIVDGIDPRDLDQGALGNCWFIAGAIAVSSKPKYIDQVIPTNQSFGSGYSGIFHFRFW